MSRALCAHCGRQVDELVLRPDLPGKYFCNDGCYGVYRLINQTIDVALNIDELSLILGCLNAIPRNSDKPILNLRNQLGEKLAPIYSRQVDLIAEAKLKIRQRNGKGR